MIVKYDKKYSFISKFNPITGFYMRTGIIKDGKDTGIDPFMCSFPELLDIGIMQTCVCSSKCNVDCYQKACDRTGKNMGLEDYISIIEQCKGKTFQIALGGAGDPDTHENFEEILKTTRKYGMVPNFTTSGITMTEEKAKICKKYCGAVAVSEHFSDYTEKAIKMLIKNGVKTSLHYVLSNKTIDNAIERLKTNSFYSGLNAIVFLLYKPVGLGKKENMLTPDDKRLVEFFNLIDTNKFPFKIGFDSCTCSGLINFTKNINLDSLDYCEGARFSAYIDANMNMMPCSFANQNSEWFMNLKTYSIKEVWNSDIFNKFRYSLSHSCTSCPNRTVCGGGCPLVNEITLCNKKEKKFVKEVKL